MVTTRTYLLPLMMMMMMMMMMPSPLCQSLHQGGCRVRRAVQSCVALV
jgi:hypothetical protein